MRRLLRIADLVVAIESDGRAWDFAPDSAHRFFEVAEGDRDAVIRVHWFPAPPRPPGEEVWTITNVSPELPPSCQLYRDSLGMWTIQVHGPPPGPFRRRVAVFRPDFAEADLYVELGEQEPEPVVPYPAGPPLDRAWFVHRLAQSGGLVVHGCGVVDEGRGYLFVGSSGAGKSTLARLWLAQPGVKVLGEDNLALRSKGSRFWAYGTPWIGESRSFSPTGTPIHAIFFLYHAPGNALHPLPLERAVERLLAHSFLPTYDPEAASRGLDFCLSLLGEVPAYTFGFLPDDSAVRFIREKQEGG